MRYIFVLVTGFLFFICPHVYGQTAQDSIKATINRLFNGMRQSDSVQIKSAFSGDAVLQTIARGKEGDVMVRTEDIKAFVEQIATLPKGAADEQIHFETIREDGPLAVVWASYRFYYAGKFSHCGVNSFQLVRLKQGWKIQYLIDTRRKQGCE